MIRGTTQICTAAGLKVLIDEGGTTSLRPDLSVVIPTYNRSDVLLKTLRSYKEQTAANEILEILVVDDGSTDGTPDTVAKLSAAFPFPIRYLRQNHKGPARGRNWAIRESRGSLVLLGDDDIIPCPTMVAEHLAWHEEYPGLSDAVLGFIEWSQQVNPTPFMRWFEKVLFNFDRMPRGLLDEPIVFSGNISFKRDFLLRNGMFDEDFPYAAWEDTELGHRLRKKGLRVFFNRAAVGYHHSRMTVEDLRRRQERVEANRELFRKKIGTTQKPVREGGAGRVALRKMGRAILPLAAPVVRLFDTQLPLPQVVYRTFYFHYILPGVEARVRSSLTRATNRPPGVSPHDRPEPVR